MTGSVSSTSTLLASTTTLAEALLDVASPGLAPGVVERAKRQDHALQAFDEIPLPVALFEPGNDRPRARNRAWHVAMSPPPPAMLACLEQVQSESAPVELAELLVERGPQRAYYNASLRLRRGCLGAPDGVVVVCAEVTEHVIARRLGVTLDTLVLSGANGHGPDHVNTAWQHSIGTSGGWQSAVHPDDLMRCVDAFAQAARQRASAQVEARLRGVEREYRWYRMQFFVDPVDGRWSCTAVDVHEAHALAAERVELLTAARAAREDAEQANRLKDEFLATVSHELRAPVTTMLLWERVLREQHDGALHAQALDAIRQSAQAQSRLVGDLLDVSRAISGKLYVDLRTIAIDSVIAEALEAALPLALAKGIRLTHKVARPLHVEGDIARLRQVLDNLLSNAIKFTDPGGEVLLATRRESKTLVVEITDTGRGIAAEFLERIFEPFHQAEDLLTRRHGGLGLGLAISRKLVELHGGELTAASSGPGCGATLTMRLPISKRTARATPHQGAPTVRFAGKRILVIDDDARVRDALALLLRRTGAVIDSVGSAAAGRDLLVKEPDVIICDIAMPGEDGYSFIRSVRATGSQIPAIALTAHALSVDATRALEAGFDIHLGKPVSLDRLVATIGNLVAGE